MASDITIDSRAQRRALLVVAGSQLLVLTLWFSASAVSPQLEAEWGLSTTEASLLTLAVQIGFVLGALASALLNLADLIPARRLFVIATIIAAGANAALVTLEGSPLVQATILRLIVGIALAGVYPAGLKVISGWFTKRRGMALGVLVGALTVGSAFPHLVRGTGLDWMPVILTSSGLALVGGLLMWLFVHDGPYDTTASPFSVKLVGAVMRNRGVRLSTYGYLGHMWELYAMWAWTAAFLLASAQAGGYSTGWVSTATFAVIAIGGVGSWWAGTLADRFGRERIAAGAMAVSGASALLSPFVFGRAPWLVMVLFLVWGMSVVADSAQFSALVTETAEDRFRGTALTLQTAVGFLLTLVTIRGVPVIAESIGWQWAFPWLAIGPALGIAAMMRLSHIGSHGTKKEPVGSP
ncbi:MAG: MFS transporter [Acidimicrobiia bacterium]|nr:MAG: MFS transporter [Acidimicrobiia bacterium]